VRLSNAVLLAQHHKVVALDILPEKLKLINQRNSPIIDLENEDFLANRKSDELTDGGEKVYTRRCILG